MRIREGDKAMSDQLIAKQATNMVLGVPGIILSPETVAVYGVLRHQNPGEKAVDYQKLGDQQLLAEAFLITGDARSRAVFMKKHPHIFR